MPEQEQNKQTLFAFRVEKWEEVMAALEEAMSAKENLLKLGVPMINKIYTRLTPIYQTAKNLRPDNYLDMIDKETIRFLQPDIIRYVIGQPKDDGMAGLLSSQLYVVAAATGNILEGGIEPYALSEFKEVIIGDIAYLDQTVFIATLRQMIIGAEEDERFFWLLNSLSPLDENKTSKPIESYQWYDTVIFSLILQALWKYFAFFDVQSQQFLLQNYLYQAIVAGVPVSFWLEQFFKSIDDEKIFGDAAAIFLKSIENNREEAPVDLATMETRKLTAIIKEYNTRVDSGSENIVVLAKEKFIADIYKNQPAAEFFSAWLREILNIAAKLKKKEFA